MLNDASRAKVEPRHSLATNDTSKLVILNSLAPNRRSPDKLS